MPKGRSWTDKDERMFEHVKESELDRGRSEDRSEEIAARTVNQQRREEGRTAESRTRGTGNPTLRYEERTRDQLENLAKERHIEGVGSMSKEELIEACAASSNRLGQRAKGANGPEGFLTVPLPKHFGPLAQTMTLPPDRFPAPFNARSRAVTCPKRSRSFGVYSPSEKCCQTTSIQFSGVGGNPTSLSLHQTVAACCRLRLHSSMGGVRSETARTR
jgi:hypothetical protein